MDILLSTENTPSKSTLPLSRRLFGKWSWWKGWTNPSDQETSSSEVYQSHSLSKSNEEEKKSGNCNNNNPTSSISSQQAIPARQLLSSKQPIEGHSKAYFSTIHSYLDNILSEVNSLQENASISAELLTIVHSLIYTYPVLVLCQKDIQADVNEITTLCSNLQLSTSKEEGLPSTVENKNEQSKVGETSSWILPCSLMNSSSSSPRSVPVGFANDGISKSDETLSSPPLPSGHSVDATCNQCEQSPQSPPISSSISPTATKSISSSASPLPSNSMDIASSLSSSSSITGPHLLVLTDQKCLLLLSTTTPHCSPLHATSYHSIDSPSSEENSILSIITTFLPLFSIDSDKDEFVDQYIVRKCFDLHDLQLVTILVQEDQNQEEREEREDQPNPPPQHQIIHIQFGANGHIFLQAEYAIFVVNEMIKRVANLH